MNPARIHRKDKSRKPRIRCKPVGKLCCVVGAPGDWPEKKHVRKEMRSFLRIQDKREAQVEIE